MKNGKLLLSKPKEGRLQKYVYILMLVFMDLEIFYSFVWNFMQTHVMPGSGSFSLSINIF